MQESFVAKEWVDCAFSKTHKSKNRLELSVKAHADTEKRYKDSLFHLAEVEKARKNAESALTGFEKHVEEVQTFLKKAETQLSLAIEKIKQQQKQLKGKDVEKVKAE